MARGSMPKRYPGGGSKSAAAAPTYRPLKLEAPTHQGAATKYRAATKVADVRRHNACLTLEPTSWPRLFCSALTGQWHDLLKHLHILQAACSDFLATHERIARLKNIHKVFRFYDDL